jgi:hypothetical protein
MLELLKVRTLRRNETTMTKRTFGVEISEPNSPPNYYVVKESIADDFALREWLLADNYEPTSEFGYMTVKAPKDYVFIEGEMFPDSELEEDELLSVDSDDERGIWSDLDVRRAYRDLDKARAMEEYVLEPLSLAELSALGISEENIFYFTID